ncbi:MAG: phage antirepressor KilAC domain-containing protein, partial [Fusobacteriaceae bacterium]
MDAIEQSIGVVSDRINLRKKIEFLQSKLTQAQPLIEFAELVRNSETQVSINDFAKSTYEKFSMGRNRLFSFMREDNILNVKNIPMHKYIQVGYFTVKMRNLGGEIKYQPLLTGKGQLWLFNRI